MQSCNDKEGGDDLKTEKLRPMVDWKHKKITKKSFVTDPTVSDLRLTLFCL